MNIVKKSLPVVVALCLAGIANAGGIGDWLTAANSAGAGYTNSGIAAPIQDDIGVYDDTTNGGVTYELIYNADVGGPSSAFMGSSNAPVGDNAGLKLDQWNATGKFGATLFGVTDITAATSYVLNTDTHVVFVAKGTDMDLYLNGGFQETLAGGSFALSGLTGIGHAYNHMTGVGGDLLNGAILGVAVYDKALSASEIESNYGAFVPEPGSFALLCVGSLFGLAHLRRRCV